MFIQGEDGEVVSYGYCCKEAAKGPLPSIAAEGDKPSDATRTDSGGLPEVRQQGESQPPSEYQRFSRSGSQGEIVQRGD